MKARGHRLHWRPERSRRFQVALRPKIRRQRIVEAAAVVLMGLLGFAAFFVAHHFPLQRLVVPDLSGWLMPRAARVETVLISGAPPVLERLLTDAVGLPAGHAWGIFEPYRAVRRLKSGFPCLKSVRFRRHWLNHTVSFEVALRRPLARALREDADLGWISDDGQLFSAPEGTYPDGDWPRAELRGSREEEVLPLAQFLDEAAKEGALPAGLKRVAYRSLDDGWELGLADGTQVLWGNMSWTAQKLARLKEVLADSAGKWKHSLTADLRYFEDGKILVRPGT